MRDLFGVYIHYPLCRRRCGYCDFPVVTRADFPHDRYTTAVLNELAWRAGAYEHRRLRAIYFGGGTPSLWPVSQVRRVLTAVRERFRGADEGVEVTLEVNPEGLEQEYLIQLRAAGVDRLSIGLQALDDHRLHALTREHTAAEGRAAVTAARKAGFHNVSCDMIVGLRGETLADHLHELEAFIALEPEHVSLYALTLSRGSALRRAGAAPVDDDLMATMLEAGREALEGAGLVQYEVSNYARAGYRSVHNSLVWAGASYLGLGAAAHSMLVTGDEQLRVINPPFSRYLACSPAAEPVAHLAGSRVRKIDAPTSRFELMMLGLRTTDGVEREGYRLRFGADPVQHYAESLALLERQGLLRIDEQVVAPTRRGIWFADEVALRL